MKRFRILTIVAFVLCGGSVASAQGASDWAVDTHSAARLIAGATAKVDDATFVRAGLEIKLDRDWHTYWRDPGDSGVPPTLDFSGSDNVKSVATLWPAPQRFPDGAGGNSIGYLDHVVLPLRVTPQDASKPSQLKLKLSYDICNAMCVPAEASLILPLTGKGGDETTLEKAEVRVPRPLALGEGESKGLAILAVHRIPGKEHERVLVDVAAPKGVRLDLFVEGPTPEWSLPLPEPKPNDMAPRQYVFDLDGLPPGAKPDGALLTFTAVSPDDAIEVKTHLD
ncbi:MAG TPA: protein-disulfide reductase DsbD domain-containing protein [Xanthobacteraceae bacterium]|jgi:DsbC/DsbD-like thiol-disulfide interchange protein|nr:protein-disulfide reductase DsbD domain-containing protein [Xanthobacteraceae bacterium]